MPLAVIYIYKSARSAGPSVCRFSELLPAYAAVARCREQRQTASQPASQPFVNANLAAVFPGDQAVSCVD